MSVTIRPIEQHEAVAFRRAVRETFGHTDTVDDEAWAADSLAPIERVRAAFDGSQIVATFQSYTTELSLPGGASLPAGAVTAVTSRPTHRRQGLATKLVQADLATSRDLGEVADVLIAAEYPIYGRFGYGPAVPSLGWEVDVRGLQFVEPGAGTVEYIDSKVLRAEGPAIHDRVRRSRAGMISRRELAWDRAADLRRDPESKPWEGFRLLCRDDDGVAQGWASYTCKREWTNARPSGTVEVADLCAATPAAEARLWRFLAELDLVSTVTAADRPVDDVLPWLVEDARACTARDLKDFLWVRPLDVAGLLTGRAYAATGRVVIEVTDELGLADGRFALDASPAGASCAPSTESPDLTLPVQTLGATSLGGALRLNRLHAAGWLDEHRPGAVATADALLSWPVAPWCNTWF